MIKYINNCLVECLMLLLFCLEIKNILLINRMSDEFKWVIYDFV